MNDRRVRFAGTPDDRLVVGIEHEYVVRHAGTPIDFSRLVDHLDLGRRLDPGDRHAHLGEWGGVITADGWEAEVATPPVAVSDRFGLELDAWADRGRSVLDAALGGPSLEGYSTHISVEVPDRRVCRVARMFVTSVAPAMMLMLDGPTSPGILVRPRRNRLEICGEYAEGAHLRAATIFATGATLACMRAPRTLPSSVDMKVEPARERYGWYVDRTAFGGDLYVEGRAATLRRRRQRVDAQRHLEDVWRAARAQLDSIVDARALAAVDEVVANGVAPGDNEPAPRLWSPWGRALKAQTPLVVARWDACVFAFGGRYIEVPRRWLATYLDEVAA